MRLDCWKWLVPVPLGRAAGAAGALRGVRPWSAALRDDGNVLWDDPRLDETPATVR